jgi:fumarate reductase subunit C
MDVERFYRRYLMLYLILCLRAWCCCNIVVGLDSLHNSTHHFTALIQSLENYTYQNVGIHPTGYLTAY